MVGHEGTLGFRDKFRQNFFKAICYGFLYDFVNNFTKTNRVEIFGFFQRFYFWYKAKVGVVNVGGHNTRV